MYKHRIVWKDKILSADSRKEEDLLKDNSIYLAYLNLYVYYMKNVDEIANAVSESVKNEVLC